MWQMLMNRVTGEIARRSSLEFAQDSKRSGRIQLMRPGVRSSNSSLRPNTALQRTRSAPLRSPLSFKTLGDTLTKIVVGVSLVASLFCASSSLAIIEKPWHVSPAHNPMSSDLYSVAEWRNVLRVRHGMAEERAMHVLGVR